jgi:predicted metal-dependent peptidase
MPALLQKIINEISCPLVPWAEHLSRWIGENGRKQDVTFAKRSRRQEAVAPEIVLPGKKRTGYPEVTILWDTSGSMNGTESEILAEVSGIIDGLGLRVRLIVCDCEIHADLEGLEDTRQVFESVIGGGGSSFCPAFERLAEEGNNSVVVAFTDGYIDVPSIQPPDLNGVLWVITEGGQRPAPWGVGLRIDKKGYGTIE